MVGDQSAPLELSSGPLVMAIGGWSGGGMGGGQNDLPAQIGSWIKALHGRDHRRTDVYALTSTSS